MFKSTFDDSKIDSDSIGYGSEMCDHCPDWIESHQTFYFYTKDKMGRTFCHPSCCELYYLKRELKEYEENINSV